MAALLHPGVYVQEIPSGIRSIEGVPTSTTVFVGETERGPLTPTKIRSASDYARLFGGHLRHSGLTQIRVTTRYETDLFFQNGGTVAYVQRASTNASVASRATRLLAASPGEWGNHVYAVFAVPAVGAYPDRFRIVVYYAAPGREAELVEDWGRLTVDPADENFVGTILQRSQYIRWIDGASPPASADDLTGLPPVNELTQADLTSIPDALFTGGGSDATVDDATLSSTILPRLNGIDDAAILVGTTERWLAAFSTASIGSDSDVGDYFDVLRTYVDTRPKQDLFLVGDAPAYANDIDPVSGVRVFDISRSNMAAIYWPHVLVADPVGSTLGASIRVPPSGAVAGLYARTDARRGVWKAPAGVEATLGGVVRLQRDTIDSEQDDLNPVGINVLRVIPGAGSVIWGARTLQPTSEWRYVPVRRTAMFLRKSIFNGIHFAVFEPNDTGLWSTLRATIRAFMETQFRNGAFAGTSSREAYFVKVDSETTTEVDQAAGIVNVLVGFAPLRPAEFVVVKLSQKTASST